MSTAAELRAQVLLRLEAGEDIAALVSELGVSRAEIDAIVWASGGERAAYIIEAQVARIRAARATMLETGQQLSMHARSRMMVDYRALLEEEKQLVAQLASRRRRRIPMHQAYPRG